MNELAHAHDRFFKKVFSQKEAAVDFLKNYLPADIAQKLDYGTLEIVKDSFVDPLRKNISKIILINHRYQH